MPTLCMAMARLRDILRGWGSAVPPQHMWATDEAEMQKIIGTNNEGFD